MDLEGNSRVGYLCVYDMYDISFTWYTWPWSKLVCMMLAILDMMMDEVKDNVYDLFVSLLGLLGLHIHIAQVDLDCGYE